MRNAQTEQPSRIDLAQASDSLRVHSLMRGSLANGPGRRFVIWVQGCSLGCPGCFNPATHRPDEGHVIPIHRLHEEILGCGDSIEGITISGGEPLQQLEPLMTLLRGLRVSSGLSVILFTGFTWDEIEMTERIAGMEWLNLVDVLIAGRYQASRRIGRGLIGSANKTVHFLSPVYKSDDLARVPVAEVMVGGDGTVLLSGSDPLR